MLLRLVNHIKRRIKDVDNLYTYSYLDTRGLRAYPKSRTRSQRLRNAKVRANVEKVNNKTIT